MKRPVIVTMLAVSIVISFTVVALANSGPVYWQGYPASGVMSVMDNTPIYIQDEKLVFDFTDTDPHFTIDGKITATYDMVNPTNEKQLVKMAFPFVGRLDSLLPEDIVITAEGNLLPYTVYVGDVVDSYGNSHDKAVSFAFTNIVKTISDELYEAENFTDHEKGKLYIIEVKPTTEQSINFAVDFEFDSEKTSVLTQGFNRYERNDKKTKIAAWCYNAEVLEIFVLGEDIDPKINAYTDGELKNQTDLLTYQISTREVETGQYLMEFIKSNSSINKHDIISDTQLYNLYAKSLDKHFAQNRGYAYGNDLVAQENYMRILTLVYAVEFQPDSSQEVSVSYKTSGTMDMRKTAKPMYSFDYIFNPAKSWSDFKNLNIEIITPQEAPYIAQSNIEFTRKEKNIYSATLAGLPEEDLSFTLYADEKITAADRFAGNLRRMLRYFAPFVISAAALLVGGALLIAFGRKRKKNKH